MLCFLPSTHYPLYDFDLRATHARTLLPAALASVSFGFVLVRVRVRNLQMNISFTRGRLNSVVGCNEQRRTSIFRVLGKRWVAAVRASQELQQHLGTATPLVSSYANSRLPEFF